MHVFSGFQFLILILTVCIVVKITMPTLEEFKESRKVAKSKVTRFGNQVSRIIAEGGNTDPISELVSKLKQAFGDFSDLHDQVVEEDKSSDICTQDEYYDQVQTKYTNVLAKASGIKFGEMSISEESDKFAIASDEAIRLFSLPKLSWKYSREVLCQDFKICHAKHVV